MSWSASKVFVSLVETTLENGAAFNLSSDTMKAALYNDTITPDNTVSLANSAYNVGQWATAQEVYDGTEWAQAGEPLTGVTSGPTSNVYKFDATDTPSGGSSATLASVYGCLVYDTTVSSYGLSYHYFGGVQSVTDGTFTIVWNASGIFTITV